MNSKLEAVRAFGRENSFEKLTAASWVGDETDGWEMTAVAAWVLEARGAYRAPSSDDALFMVLTEVEVVE